MEPRTSYLAQSDLVADADGWAEGEKSEQLALCLRGNVAGVLGAMPPFFQQNFRERRARRRKVKELQQLRADIE